MSEELKPCPLCGGTPDAGLQKTPEGNYRNIIYCTDCGLSVDAVFSKDEPKGGGKWNRRATPSPDSAAGEVESETHVLVDDGLGAAPLDMGSPAEAARILARLTAEWRELRQPSMGTAAEQKKRDIREHNVRFEVANAALNWLWHREHAADAGREDEG
ncbi:restriction alleviation protein, Lar family [Acetobacteraceae bacterium AT-5844]|nr:restriction alleviation protein, Lar family [Acetobacteraceae bacterium AT-5844]